MDWCSILELVRTHFAAAGRPTSQDPRLPTVGNPAIANALERN